MSKPPAFQFYVNDWLGSANIMLMTPAEEGAYIRLLAIAWGSDDCGLPDDDKELSVLSRLGEGWFNGTSTKLRKCFIQKGTRLYNKRLLEERKKQEIWKEKSRQGGIKSGRIRNNSKLEPERWLNDPLSEPVEPKGNSSSSSSFSSSSSLLNLFKDYCKDLIQPQELSEDRKRKISTRLRKHPDLEWWKDVFIKANEVCIPGKDGKSDWSPTFDWLIDKDKNALKVKEGNYSTKPKGQHKQQGAENLLRRLEDEERGPEGICQIDGGDGGSVRGGVKRSPDNDLL
jgi:uncharacterized protein YdaU (DUF1376 family)